MGLGRHRPLAGKGAASPAPFAYPRRPAPHEPRISVPPARLSGCASNSPAACCARLRHATLFSPKNVSRPARPNRDGGGTLGLAAPAYRAPPTGYRRIGSGCVGWPPSAARPSVLGRQSACGLPFHFSLLILGIFRALAGIVLLVSAGQPCMVGSGYGICRNGANPRC
jgi:hypothetical protein